MIINQENNNKRAQEAGALIFKEDKKRELEDIRYKLDIIRIMKSDAYLNEKNFLLKCARELYITEYYREYSSMRDADFALDFIEREEDNINRSLIDSEENQ